MKTLTAAILCFIFQFSLMYGQGIIHGSVMDSLTWDQLSGAEVTLTGSTFSGVSNTDGEFHISGIPPGEYMLQASYLGYKEKKYLINIHDEETLKLTIELLPIITVEDQAVFTQQAGRQAEEMNRQISSNTIKNVSAGKTLQDMPDENIPVALSRIPGVSTIHGPTFPRPFTTWSSGTGGTNNFSATLPPGNDLSFANDPGSKVLIRGLDSKYSNMTIDGMRISPTSAKDKSVDLSTLSERDFQNIEVRKTITSDEEGDATAGAVTMVTGKAPSERMLKAELLGNDNALDKSTNQYQFTGSYSERFFDNLLGVQVVASAEKKIMSSEYHSKDIMLLSPSELLYTNAVRERNGAHMILDYSTPDGGSIKFHNIYYKTNTTNFESMNNNSIMLFYPEYIFCERETDQNIVLSSLGGRNYLLGFDIDWNAAYSESKTNHPFYYTLTFLGYPSYLPPDFTGPTYLDHTVESPSNNFCNEKTASLDLDKKYTISNELTGELKFGGKYRTGSRLFEEHLRGEGGGTSSNLRRLGDGSFVQKDFSSTRFDGLLSKSNKSIYLSYFQDNPPGQRILFNEDTLTLINNGALRVWHDLNYSPYYVENGTDINSYNLSESVVAGYIMHSLNFGQSAKFIIGLRIESEKNSYGAYYFPTNISDAATLYDSIPLPTNTNQYNKTSLLPNFHMILEPTDFLTLRLAAYKTLIRPDCIARMPKFFSIAVQGIGADAGNYLSMGNPDLKNADIWNYELQTQFYGNGIGQLSIHAFYKDIEGMVQETNGIQLSGATPLESLGINWSSYSVHYPFNKNSYYNVFTYFNSPKPTRIWGFEIEHQANFRYLPGPLNNIILNYNLTFLRSETWAIDALNILTTGNYSIVSYTKQKLNTMPEFCANIILGYDIKGFSFRISYFYQGEYPISDTYRLMYQIEGNKFSRLDIALKQQLLNNVSIFLNLNNITNSKEETLYKSPFSQFAPAGAWQTVEAYRNGMNFDFGIGINL
jgi:TonB-dependent receptor